MISIIYNIIIIVLVISVDAQTPQSPCPGIFDYEVDGQKVYGLIHVPFKGVNSVEVKVNFTIAAALYSNYIGSLRPLTTLSEGKPIEYKVEFPIQSPLPKLTSLVINGETLCTGQPDRLGSGASTVTSAYLEHSQSISGGTSFGSNDVFAPSFSSFINGYNFKNPGSGTIVIRPDYTASVIKVPWPYETQDNKTPPSTLQTNFGRVPEIAPPPPPPPQSNPETSVQDSKPFECGMPIINAPLILGGEEYLRGALPWLVALFTQEQRKNKQTFICAGTLVSDHHVVTAAHCVYLMGKRTEVESLIVTVGAFNLSDLSDDAAKNIYIKDAITHNDYDSFSLKNDIAVLTLKKRVTFNSYVIPICLWDEHVTDPDQVVGRKGVVAGWGINEKSEAGRGRPLKARIPIVSIEECRNSHKGFLKRTSENTICAGDRNKANPCSGDSGGGLYLRYKGTGDKAWRLRGIISLSLENEDDDSDYECNIQEYVILTDAAKYTSWIKNIIETT